MKMKKLELRMMIRKIVREEVAMSIKEVINEITKPTIRSKKKVVERKKHFTKNSVLNEILNETASNDDWKTIGGGVNTTDDMANVMAKSYGDMMNTTAEVDVRQMAVESNVNPETVPDHVEKALTRDYSDLMKVINKQDGK